ncbi:hypothetical protein NQ315_014812 [Exocentrus adspersus]|uniref:Uncharacterized protein n=1 Tax=Exocentrus adspersus TaxID=1586481 RepID=A0AAV8VM58_9CUCU|nr:hypothetical protein NQ315_014812 [Exocentrus adspersus]
MSKAQNSVQSKCTSVNGIISLIRIGKYLVSNPFGSIEVRNFNLAGFFISKQLDLPFSWYKKRNGSLQMEI